MELPSLLVVDANVLFSFFQANSGRRRLIEQLRSTDCGLISPDYVLEELTGEKERISRFANITESEFVFLLALLERTVRTVGRTHYQAALGDAERLAPHEKDEPYFALAIATNASIWSDETAFQNQDSVPIYTTDELFTRFE